MADRTIVHENQAIKPSHDTPDQSSSSPYKNKSLIHEDPVIKALHDIPDQSSSPSRKTTTSIPKDSIIKPLHDIPGQSSSPHETKALIHDDPVAISTITETSRRPAVGEIHSLRISMTNLFGTQSNFESSSYASLNRSTGSSTSSKKSDNRPKKRPCLVWRTSYNVQVLIMSKFNGIDVTDLNVSFFDHLPRDYVLKRLLAVYPKKPFGGRKAIAAATTTTTLPIFTTDTNMILIPTVVEDNKLWKPAREYFPREELNYINKILFEIATEENKEQAKAIEEVNHPLVYNGDDQNDNSSSSGSSLPRVRTDFMENINLNKNDRINKWLNDVVIDNGNDDAALISENLLPTTSWDNSENHALLGDPSTLSLFNGTGRDLLIDRFDGVELAENSSST